MLVAQREQRSAAAAPAVGSPVAPQRPAHVASGAPRSPQHNADLPLSRTLARAVQQRARDLHVENSCAAYSTGGLAAVNPLLARCGAEPCGCGDTRTSEPPQPVTERMLQRSVGHPAEDLPPCTPLAAEKPDEKTWFADPVLQKVRIDIPGANKQIIATRSDKPHVRRATQLVEEALLAWGCEELGVDVLDGKTPNGEFDSKTKTAINAFQAGPRKPSEIYLAIDGKVGPLTLQELDWFIGHTPPPVPKPPVPPPPKPEPPPVPELDKDEVRALTFLLIGTRPKDMTFDHWVDVLKKMYDFIDTLADAVEGGTMIPVPVEEMKEFFTKFEEHFAGRDALNGFTYALMDTATGTKRSEKELAGARLVHTKKGFTQGYRLMQKHMYSTHARSTTHLKGALEALASQPDRVRTMRIIYKALRDTYWNRPPLGGRYLGASHYCAHNYPQMYFNCGERDDILRPPPLPW